MTTTDDERDDLEPNVWYKLPTCSFCSRAAVAKVKWPNSTQPKGRMYLYCEVHQARADRVYGPLQPAPSLTG